MNKILEIILTLILVIMASCDSEKQPQENEYRYKDIIFEEFDPLGITKAPCNPDTFDLSKLSLDSIYSYPEIYAYFNGDLSPENITSFLGENYSMHMIDFLGEFEFGINYRIKNNHNRLNYIIINIPYCKIQYHEWKILNPQIYLAVYYIENKDSLFPIFAWLFQRYITVYEEDLLN